MAKIAHNVTGLTNGVTYYGKVFSVNPKERVNNRADLAVFAAVPSEFPAEPSDFALIGTYTSAQTWIAPEDGWYKVEVFGASGNGGSGVYEEREYIGDTAESFSGGGGGSGGYASSVVKLNAGDVLSVSPGAQRATTTVTVDSAFDEYDHTITVTAAAYGGNGQSANYGTPKLQGGAGGVASGGLTENINGNRGGNGTNPDGMNAAGGYGGAAVVPGGNAGGSGATISGGVVSAFGKGAAGFVKISRGNTNVTA